MPRISIKNFLFEYSWGEKREHEHPPEGLLYGKNWKLMRRKIYACLLIKHVGKLDL